MPQMNVHKRAWSARVVAIACLLLFFALGLRSTLTLSPTNDEPAHMLRGFVLRSTGSFQYQTGHAPLSHRLIGLLLTGDETAPEVDQLPSWPDGERLQLASELLWESGVDADRFLFLARLPILWMGVILGGLIAGWALSWHGRAAMVVALVLFAASPNLLASAALATTDFVTVVTYFGTIYAWWRTWKYPSLHWWLLTGILFGLALATKLTAVLLLPVLFLLTFLFLHRGKPFWRPFLSWMALVPVALFVLWIVYGLQIDRLAGWPWPIPAAAYVISWQNVLAHVERGHRAFYLGELSGDGWWSYFPLTFLIKTPLVTIGLLVIGLGVIISKRALWRTALFLLLPAGALFAAAMTSRLNIGYRHILPVIPFLIVIASTAVLFLRHWAITRILLILALAWYVFAAIRQQPAYLAYFNELVGGTAQGYRYLGDSNLDWGQDLKRLATEIEQDGGEWIISYAGVADPGYYGLENNTLIDHETGELPFAAANPAAGRYAISVNHWQGILEDADTFDWFRRQPIHNNIGGSILIYEIAGQASGEWIAHCVDPAPILAPDEAERLVGNEGLRHYWFDCRQSWILPGGEVPGWYVLPQADMWWPMSVMSNESIGRMGLVYRHRATADAPSYDVYYWSGGALQPGPESAKHVAQTSAGQDVSLPFTSGDMATLHGYQVDGNNWINFWTVESGTDQPLSMRAHLYVSDQETPLVADGLGYAADQWQTADTLWQRHHFVKMAGAEYLETGLYNYQTLEVIGDMLNLPANGS